MTPVRWRAVLAAMLLVAVHGAPAAAPRTDRWIALPTQPDSRALLDAASVQRIPSGPVSAWVRVETHTPNSTRALRRMFDAVRGDTADFLYTIDCRTRQYTVSSAKLYQGALMLSEKRFGNEAGWQPVDGASLATAVAHHLCAG
ncbi:surface-adhesin E family protein [Ralstonia pseudosolanacearum]|uniref:surface-adhesin E family protein n=1 Tax=Ralstonia pseudosolanacearum TaxID=1310165 RepID=UPI0023DB2724|nr:surface-adhesin E family protein [Ralstonia pseudosolanacearum]